MRQREEKILRGLEVADHRLRDQAIECLRSVASGRDTGFFYIKPWVPSSCSKNGSEIFDEASRLVAEYAALGEDARTTTAQALLNAFNTANNGADHHRLGPIRFAEQLLGTLGAA